MKRLLILGIILALLLPVLTMADKGSGDLEILNDILKEMGADFEEGEVVTNGILIKRFIKEGEMNQLGEDIILKLGITGSEEDPLIESKAKLGEVYHKSVILEDNYSQINYEGYDEDNNLISIYLSSYLYDEDLKGETYLCINIVKKDVFFQINGIIDKVESIYNEHNATMDTTSCLIGTIEGRQTEAILRKNIKKIIRKKKGNIIGEFSDGKMLSYKIGRAHV